FPWDLQGTQRELFPSGFLHLKVSFRILVLVHCATAEVQGENCLGILPKERARGFRGVALQEQIIWKTALNKLCRDQVTGWRSCSCLTSRRTILKDVPWCALASSDSYNLMPKLEDLGSILRTHYVMKDPGSGSDTPSLSSVLERQKKEGPMGFRLGLSPQLIFKTFGAYTCGGQGLRVSAGQAQALPPHYNLSLSFQRKNNFLRQVLRLKPSYVFYYYYCYYSCELPFSQTRLATEPPSLCFEHFGAGARGAEILIQVLGLKEGPASGRILAYNLAEHCRQKCISRGELQVSLSYQPVVQRMTVVVLKARHLPKMDITGLSDPYVKVNVYYGRKRIAKKKTHVKKCTLNPVFNESFIYDIPTDLLPDISIEFLVIDFDRTTKNEVVGRLILGAHSVTASGAEHWREVCDSPRKPIAKWHSLSEY
ncbi:synaptotagmin-11 isoform X2, partial [Sigmodon hispidus]